MKTQTELKMELRAEFERELEVERQALLERFLSCISDEELELLYPDSHCDTCQLEKLSHLLRTGQEFKLPEVVEGIDELLDDYSVEGYEAAGGVDTSDEEEQIEIDEHATHEQEVLRSGVKYDDCETCWTATFGSVMRQYNEEPELLEVPFTYLDGEENG